VLAAEEYLDQLGADLRRDGFTVETGVPFGGHPAEWIVEESEILHTDLIVMASHGRAGVDRWVHGSVAEAVVHGARPPVMLVKGSGATEIAQRLAAQTPVIVVPLDQSRAAESALPIATQTAVVLGGRLLLVSVLPIQAGTVVGTTDIQMTYTDAEYTQFQNVAAEYLRSVTERLERGGIAAEPIVRLGEPGVEIAFIAEQYAAAAVVMATHGRTGVIRSMLGSVAGAVVHRGTSPVVLIRPHGPQAAAAGQVEYDLASSSAS
jgi:nucleotide-binding universal stress UspA family protein